MHVRLRVAIPLLLACLAAPAAAEPLRVVATTEDLGSLTASVGGDEVELSVLARGPQDPHFVEPRPSFVRALHRADLFVVQGMQLEIGWAPALQRSARNPDVMPGGAGYVDASSVVAPLEVPTGTADRSMGDVHPLGNPHYLSDPLNGMRVARLLRDRLSQRRPERERLFAERYDAFAQRLVVALVGAEYAQGRTPESILQELDGGVAPARPGFPMGGWLGLARSKPGLVAVQDHRLWPYFAQRFGLRLIETLEPKPGIAPTTRHLAHVVAQMQAEHASLVLASTYFDPRHAAFVSERTGARVALMAHQVGAREGTDDYLAVVDHNVRAVFAVP